MQSTNRFHPIPASPILHSLKFALLMVGAASAALAQVAPAQSPQTKPQLTQAAMEMVKQRTVQISPALVLLTPSTKTVALDFVNVSDTTLDAEVALEFSSPRTNANGTIVDSVLAGTSPGSLTTWLTGLPQRVTLAPREKKSVSLAVTVPPNTADGEYWGRIVVRRNGVAMRLPATVNGAATAINSNVNLRFATQVFYRQGPMSTGLQVSELTATPSGNAVRACMAMHRTGPAHVDGTARVTIRVEATGEEKKVVTAPISVYEDLRPCLSATGLAPGKYAFVLSVDGERQDIPAAVRVPFAPVKVSVPFEIPAAGAM